MKKRLFAILVLALVMVLALTSCEFIQNIKDKLNPPAEEYAVYFTAGDGIGVPTQTVKEGGLVTKPSDPARVGYVFDGWYKDEGLTNPWNFETDTVTNNTIIYGKWVECTHSGGEATCTKGAVCEVCGATYTDPLGHDIVVTGAAVDPTCTETGLTEGLACSRCDAKSEQEVIPALGHKDENSDYVCDRCGEDLDKPVFTTTVLDPESEHATPAQGPQTVRIGEFEIILSSEKSRIESKNVTFTLPDETSVPQNMRINFNGSASIYNAETGEWQNVIWFNTSGKGTVTIYWQHGGKGSEGDTSEKAYRNVAIWDAEGNLIAQTNEQYIYEELVITTFEFDAAGTYYIGNIAGANNFFYVEVTYEGELAPLPELPKYNVHFNTGEGSAVNSLQVEENATVAKPEDPTRDGYEFGGWYKDEECTTPWNFSTDRITEDTVLYAKWNLIYVGEYEDVHYELNIGDLDTGSRSEDEINGRFTIVSGSEVRGRTKVWTDPEDSTNTIEFTKSVKIGNSSTMIKIDVPGDGKLAFYIQNGSSGAAVQYTKVIAPDGTVYDIEFAGTDEGSPVVRIEIDVTEGEWTIARGKNGGTQDVFMLELDCSVPVSPETGFELVDAGKVDYVAGEELDLSKVVLNATFESGKTEPLAMADVTVDSSAFNKDLAGTYTITISYKEYTPITYTVSVYAPSAVELDFDAVEKLAQNSSAGNGVYFNYSFKEVYDVNEALNTAGLSVTVVATNGTDSKSFRVSLDQVTISGFDPAVVGKQTLTVAYGSVSATVDVHVVDTAPAEVNGVYQAKVDKAYDGAIGAVVDGFNMFTTIQQALDFLARVDANEKKLLVIGEGLFTEKLEITIPNLTIRGAGQDKTTIEWDSLYGLVDAGGFTHTTDSTQTVAVRDNATGVTIEDLTISNYWNTQERMDAAGLAIERGLALLVQADRFVMKNSRLLGIQDTLELFTGRQYFENVFISGYTDFIFGTNNTTYFKNCTVHVIDTGKDDAGTAGYLTAFKGSNKGANDAIVYGAIFDGCKFTADEGVMQGKTAIGRTWGAYAAVAVINSELGGHISLDGYVSSENKNKRYISMNGVHPTDETVQFVEYNNTGAGAITEPVAGMRMLTAEEAAKYADFATIFGTTNGKVSYLDAWDPFATEVVVDDRTYYYFDQNSSTTGTSHTFDTTATIERGGTLDWEGLHISAENGNVAWNSNANALNMKSGAFISFEVPAGTLVSVTSYPGYNYFTINGVGTSADTLNRYFAEATTVTVASVGDLYLYNIIINPGEEAPEAAALTELKASGMNVNYSVGDELSLEGLVVKALFSDNSVVTLTANDYAVDSTAVDVSAAGTYDVVITYGGKSVTVTVNYEDPNADPAITKNTTLDFTTPAGLEAVQNNPRVTINGSVRHNGAEIQIKGTISFQVKAGTVVSVIPYANASYASYKLYAEGESSDLVLSEMYSMMFFEDCTVVYEGLDNNYLCSIAIECPLGEGKYVFGNSTAEGDVTGILESIDGMSIAGTFKAHSGGAQMGSDSQIIFIVGGLTTVTIQGFDTNYGQLLVLVDGETVEMDANAQYVFTTLTPSTVIIKAVNVGTEEAPAWNKSYITYIDIQKPLIIDETTEITFGSEGNYKNSPVDFSGITIGDNGGNNSQVKNGSFKFAVKEGAIVTIHGYPGYTSYQISDAYGTLDITDEYYTYTAFEDMILVIGHVTGNNYFYSISVVYPVYFEENTTIDLSATGVSIQKATGIYEGLEIDATNGKFADNGGGWVQVNQGTVIRLNVLEGAEVSVSAYSSADNFTVVIENGVCTITAVGNDYLNAITVNYPIVYTEPTTIDLSATGASIQGGKGVYEGLNVDATTGKFADNGGGWVQVNAGTVITLNVFEGAVVSVSAYSSADNFTVVVANGVCTITAVGNDYLNAITIAAAPAEPEEVTYVLDSTLDLPAIAQGDKADGQSDVINEFFTLHYSAKLKVDGSNKTFDDGYSATQRISFGGKSVIGDSIINAIEFTVEAGATVKVWWVSGGDGRTIAIVDESGASIGAVGSDSVKNALYISELTITEAGKYYITVPDGSNYIFKVEVTTTK